MLKIEERRVGGKLYRDPRGGLWFEPDVIGRYGELVRGDEQYPFDPATNTYDCSRPYREEP